MFIFEALNTLEHGLSACTGNHPWYYNVFHEKVWGGGGGGGGQKIDLISILLNIYFYETLPTLLCFLYKLVRGNSEFLAFK